MNVKICSFSRLRGHNKRPNRPDVTKMNHAVDPNSDGVSPNKVSRGSHGGAGLPGGRAAASGEFDPNSSDHVVAMTQLKEQIASLQKLVAQKDSMILTKDKMVNFSLEENI